MEHRISFNFNARYETLGEISDSVEHLWFICHGHGHLAKYFIKKFECLNDGKHLIVAPEGLSRYYLDGFFGRVGATWMTKEDRLNDIDNYLVYLEAVYREVREQLNPNVKVTLLGFSQGGATISRFATQTNVEFHRLVLWAGIFPPDLPPIQSQERLKGIPCYVVYGLNDEFLTEDRIKEQDAIAEQLEVKPEVLTFDGKHELNDELLQLIDSKA